MITLHVYMAAKDGHEGQLESGIRDCWIAEMAEQPGFLHAALLKPFSDDALDAVSGFKPPHTFEIVSCWESEEKRLEWVARPIHDRVFEPLFEHVAEVRHTLATVEHAWEL